jgi:hypothetical protein
VRPAATGCGWPATRPRSANGCDHGRPEPLNPPNVERGQVAGTGAEINYPTRAVDVADDEMATCRHGADGLNGSERMRLGELDHVELR